MTEEADRKARDKEHLADLMQRRADVYAEARQHPSYYGDDDIDLLRRLLEAAERERDEARASRDSWEKEARFRLQQKAELSSQLTEAVNDRDAARRERDALQRQLDAARAVVEAARIVDKWCDAIQVRATMNGTRALHEALDAYDAAQELKP